MENISTGVRVLDNVLGKNRLPFGKIINIVGDKSSGKTALACEFIFQAKQQLGKKLKYYYDDAEAGFSFNTKEMYGFDICPEDNDPSITIEDFEVNLQNQLKKLKSDEYLIYVLDSFDSLTSYAELKKGEEVKKKIEKTGEYDGKKDGYNLDKQYNLNQFFRRRRLEIKDKNCLLILISQVRENIGVMFGKKYRRNGGKALDFYSSQILWLAEAEKYTKWDWCYGICTKIKADKNKTGKPFRHCYVDILFDYGVDAITSNLLFLYDLKTDTGKTKSTIKKIKNKETKVIELRGVINWDGNQYNLQELVKYIEYNNLEQELEKRVQKKWDEKEDSIDPIKGFNRKPKI